MKKSKLVMVGNGMAGVRTLEELHVANKRVLPRVARPADIEAAIERLYGKDRSAIDDIVHFEVMP